jgi:uncharacterized protein
VAEDVHPQVRIVVQPYGSGLPLGFFSFGIGMFLLAAAGAGWVAVVEQRPIGLLLAAFVFPLELLAAIVAFLAVTPSPAPRSASSLRRGSRSGFCS